MTEESESHPEKLLNSLQEYGVSIPNNVLSIQDLKPATFFSLCAQCLNLIDQTASYPTSLPDATIDKLKICTDIALAIKRLGYIGDMSYYKLLYPSEEDLYKLARFLAERLSKSPNVKITDLKDVNASGKIKVDSFTDNSEHWTEKDDNEALYLGHQSEKLKNLSLTNAVPDTSNSSVRDVSLIGPSRPNLSKDKLPAVVNGESLDEDGKVVRDPFADDERSAQKDDEYVQKATSIKEQSPKIQHETEELRNQEKVLMEEVTAKTSELRHLEEEFELLKAAAEMAFDDERSIDFYLEKLNEQVDAKECNVRELKSQWDVFRKPVEDKKRSLEESLYANIPDAQEKLQKLRELELEKQSMLSEIRKREEEHLKLSANLQKQPELPSRTSYIERIKEITKNSRKQDADIQRILQETRELQLESNSIQERLHRTYAVLDEIVFREAKKDPVGRKAYRLLTSIHDCFEEISEKILTTDRIRREMAEHEKKLAAMASRSLNVDKLQADLDAIVKENEYREQHLKEN